MLFLRNRYIMIMIWRWSRHNKHRQRKCDNFFILLLQILDWALAGR